jgi:hypothetical protein
MAPRERVPQRVERARHSLEKLLREKEGFVGVGVGRDAAGRWILQVLVTNAACRACNTCPDVHRGCPVTLAVSGPPTRQ